MDCSTCRRFENVLEELHEYESYLNYSGYYATCIAVLKSVNFVEEQYAKHKVNEVHPEMSGAAYVT